MAKQPNSVEIRSFQVGFGDCFLLSFVYDDSDKRHVLIDFGTTELPQRQKAGKKQAAKPSEYMPTVAKAIQAIVGDGNRLTAVVATHRHADHISGFGTDNKTGDSGSIVKALRPKLVLQPWTEDPNAKTDAKKATSESNRTHKGFVSSLAAMHVASAQIAELAQSNPSWMGVALRKELSFLGMENIANKSAVDNLIAMGKARDAKRRFLRFGDASGLDALLPGVKVRVLGPPDLTQTEKIKKQRSRDPDQFWHLIAGARADGALAHGVTSRGAKRTAAVPVEARWFRQRLNRIRGQSLLEIVRSLDDQMNNTSVILLFEVLGKKLLFPGDAQIENWSYALEEAPESKEIRQLLASVDVYKVGHHGSLNATPRKLLWEQFRKRKGRKLQTLLSTLPGKHGNPRKDTEVPRTTLLKALDAESQLKNTNKLKFGAKPELCHCLELSSSGTFRTCK